MPARFLPYRRTPASEPFKPGDTVRFGNQVGQVWSPAYGARSYWIVTEDQRAHYLRRSEMTLIARRGEEWHGAESQTA